MFRRKAQSEVVGLLVIVIILIFLGFIYLRFNLQPESAEYEDVRQSIQAQGLLKALINLETGGESFKEKISGCYYDSGQCIGLEGDIEEVFGAVLEENEDYKLILYGEGDVLMEIGDCGNGIVGKMPFIFDSVFYESSLILCK